jgi:molybdopterin synthase catalytic subunit
MIEIRREDFSIDEVIKRLKSPQIGAIVIYLGTVREGQIEGLGLKFENDKDAAQKLAEIREAAINRFDIEDVAIIHRTGLLNVTEKILLIAVSAVHRWAAFDACQFIIDGIKELHKSWKREVRTS